MSQSRELLVTAISTQNSDRRAPTLCRRLVLDCRHFISWIVFSLLVVGESGLLLADSGSGVSTQSPEAETQASESFRMREGLELKNEVGEFRDGGGRITFYPTNQKLSLTILENLALERIYNELEKRGQRRKWNVSGVVTEYRGNNYLRITRAVLKPKEPTTESLRKSRDSSPTGGRSADSREAG